MQANLESRLSKLVSIKSASNEPNGFHEVISHIRDELRPYGLFIKEDLSADCPWLIATTQDTDQPDILLMAHLDVVPAPAELYAMEKREGKLYGRGVFDMKFAAACYLEFIKAHADQLKNMNIGLLFTTDEESGSASMTDVMATGLRPKLVFLPDGGDNWTVEKRAKGFSALELIARGKAAHGSRPWEGKNAILMLLDALQEIRKKYPLKEPGHTTVEINMIGGGKAFNQIPDYASAGLDFRSFSLQEQQEFLQFIAQLAASHDLEVKVLKTGSPVIFDEAAPAAQTFLKHLREHLDIRDTPFSESYGGTDARFFVEYNIPCIIIEPHGGGRHAVEEWLLADDLEKFYQLIEKWLLASDSSVK